MTTPHTTHALPKLQWPAFSHAIMLQLTLLTFPTAASPGLQIQQSDYLHKYGAAVVQSICSNLFLSVTIYDEAFTVWRMMENSV